MELSTNQKIAEIIKRINGLPTSSIVEKSPALLIEVTDLLILKDMEYIDADDVLSQKMMFDVLSQSADFNSNSHGYMEAIFITWVSKSPNVFAGAYKLGYRHNSKLTGIDNARRAANGRRLIGATTRENVKREAAKHMHLNKGAAAYEISSKINLSPDRVRKLLSELFPGDSWVASADATSHNSRID